MTENDTGPTQRLRLEPSHKAPFDLDEDAVTTTRVTSRIQSGYGAVTPHTRPEDFTMLREEFETGVAEDAAREG